MSRFILALVSFIAGIAVFDILADAGSGSLGRVLLNLVISTGAVLILYYAGEWLLNRRNQPSA